MAGFARFQAYISENQPLLTATRVAKVDVGPGTFKKPEKRHFRTYRKCTATLWAEILALKAWASNFQSLFYMSLPRIHEATTIRCNIKVIEYHRWIALDEIYQSY